MSILELFRRGLKRLVLPIHPTPGVLGDPPNWVHLKAANALPVSAEHTAARDVLQLTGPGVAQSSSE